VLRVISLSVFGLLLVSVTSSIPAGAGAPPVHSVLISGEGVGPASTWPAYDPAVERYAVSTTASTGGTLVVTANTTDTTGVVRVNGRVASGSTATVSGLGPGDEVNVQIVDSAGTSNQSFVYLPAGFPQMTATSVAPGASPGHVFLTTTGFFAPRKFETVVDSHGVPVYVREQTNPMDLKLQPNGHYSVARGLTNQLDSTFEIVELDSRFDPVASYTNASPLQNTEFHDSVLLPSGGRILMAYEPAATGTDIDSVVQEIGPDGSVALTWNSADHTESVDRLTNLRDYAHLNSIDVMQDGNLLLSFRHLSQVMKVDRRSGAVLWRLGGPRSTFSFPDDPLGGPCAQHTARELANGDIQIWDNGSKVTSTTLQPMCPDPAEPTAARIERPLSRVVTYHLDETAHTATLAQEFRPYNGDSFSEFAGSAQRLGAGTLNDNVLLGMADARDPHTNTERPDVVEVDKDGNVLWTLDIPGIFSYRAQKFAAPDAIAPTVSASGVVDGATYAATDLPTLTYVCADRGGSNLDTCAGSVLNGSIVPMTAGTHSVSVTATDREGNSTTRVLGYTVLATPPGPTPTPPPTPGASSQPDASIRVHGHRWRGGGVIGPVHSQTVSMRLDAATATARRVDVRVRNVGVLKGRLRLTGTARTRGFGVVALSSGRDVGRLLRTGRLLTPRLDPGETYRLRLLITRRPSAVAGDSLKFSILVATKSRPDERDRVAVHMRAR
jgi:hypothetical protein